MKAKVIETGEIVNVTVYKNLRKTMSLLSFYFLIQRNTAF